MRKVLLILNILLVLASLGLSGYIWFLNNQNLDVNGFTTSTKIGINTISPVIVFSDHEFNMRENIPAILQIFINPDDLLIERWAVKNKLSKEVFIGITTSERAYLFLKNVSQKEAYNWDVKGGPWEMDIWVDLYKDWPGVNVAQAPLTVNIWLASGSGSESAYFEKRMVSGSYYVLIMNSNGSPGLDVDLSVGGKIPLILQLPIVFFVLGIMFSLILVFNYREHLRSPMTSTCV